MPEPVLFMRGFPRPPFEHPSALQELFDDLKTVIGLSNEQFTELRKHLTEAKGFLDPKAMLETIRRVVEDANAAEAVRRILINIGPSQVERMVTALEEGREEEGFPFDEAQLERLKQILKNLIRPYPALARFRKAERLAKITGQQLEAVELICDLRPIFDENRKNVEGMMPYTRLHIVATGEDGLPKPFEVELTHQEIIDLLEKVEKAKSKLETLHQSIKNWLPDGLPDLLLTRIPRKESSDD